MPIPMPTVVIISTPSIPAAVIAVIISVSVIGSVMAVVAAAVPIPVIRPSIAVIIGSPTVIAVAGTVEDRDWNRQPKGKVNASARRRCGDERQSRDNQQEDNELFHI